MQALQHNVVRFCSIHVTRFKPSFHHNMIQVFGASVEKQVRSCMDSFEASLMQFNSYQLHLVLSFTHSFIHSFIPSFIRSFVRSYMRSFLRSFIHSFIHSFHSCMSCMSCIHACMRSCVRACACVFACMQSFISRQLNSIPLHSVHWLRSFHSCQSSSIQSFSIKSVQCSFTKFSDSFMPFPFLAADFLIFRQSSWT